VAFVSARSEVIPRVSVVVPLHRDGSVFRRCLREIVEMKSEQSFEVVVVSDRVVTHLPAGVAFASTGSQADTSPAEKRDKAVFLARGEYLAFIDDDAYPRSDWLDSALLALVRTGAVAVGGPGVTPPDSPWRERMGGAVYESRLGSGPLRHRFVSVAPPLFSDDLPAYNLVISREALEAVGGWSSTFYGGEDTKLCLTLVQAGFRLLYDPQVVVFHNRRPILIPHLRQVANVGRHSLFASIRRLPARASTSFPPRLHWPRSLPFHCCLRSAGGGPGARLLC
jgi:cellulose synthase/poly-beta-1,6-N-acetylglucosamine synthase-like glycosyltransferase